jgi:SAM-dependent methyltransferase
MTGEQAIRFDDGAGYEQMMGAWSRLVADLFLDWLSAPAGLRWIDVGCGNGAVTERVVERCAPTAVHGIDISEAQIAYARARPRTSMVDFRVGDARSLPFAVDSFDIAMMALVIFFIPVPGDAATEMMRVTRPGGTVASYAWDMLGGGFPQDPILDEMKGMGIPLVRPPQMEVSQMQALRSLWHQAGLEQLETREITVHRTFANFEEFWSINMKGSSVGPTVAGLPAADAELLRQRVRKRLPTAPDHSITYSARANAIKGLVPMQGTATHGQAR